MFNYPSNSEHPYRRHFGARFVKNYNFLTNDLENSKNRNSGIYAPLNYLGERALGLTYATVKTIFDPYDEDPLKPSAVIASNGINNEMSKNQKQRKKFSKEEKKVARKATRKVVKNVAKKLGFSKKNMSNAFVKNTPRGKRFIRFGQNFDRVISTPMVKGVISKSGATVMKSHRPNCITLKSSAYLGQLNRIVTTNPSLFCSFIIDGAVETGGQFFFNPANAAYMPPGSNFVQMSRMFQTYYIRDIAFTFKAKVTPASTTQYSIVYGFFSDPNYGETVITGYGSNVTIAKTNILALPDAGDFPAWTPEFTIRPPRRFYSGKKFRVRGGEFDAFMPTGTNNGNVALNWASYAFGMWMTVDGANPGATLPMSDIYMHLTMDLCDMAPAMIYDALGSSTFGKGAVYETSKKIRSKGSDSLLSCDDRELLDRLKQIDLKDRFEHGENLKPPRRILVSEDEDEVLYRDISSDIGLEKKKSSSIKSTKSLK